jgi:uncharacterized membrane protein YidH (DUF202 family)
MKDEYNEEQDNPVVDEILVLLQEKRTILAMIRIGIAIIMAQISILGFLIVTSKFYEWMEVLHLLIPFALLNLVVLGIAGYLIFGSLIQIHQLDRQILAYKKSHGGISHFMD